MENKKIYSFSNTNCTIKEKRRRDESALLVRALGTNCHASGFDASRGRTAHPCHQKRILGLRAQGIPSRVKLICCLTGPGNDPRSGEP